MDGRLIRNITGGRLQDGQHWQYAWSRFNARIAQQKLNISTEEKNEVRNYIYNGVELQNASHLKGLADECLEEAMKNFNKK